MALNANKLFLQIHHSFMDCPVAVHSVQSVDIILKNRRYVRRICCDRFIA